jgi:very-short-patch-repair endonuclease
MSAPRAYLRAFPLPKWGSMEAAIAAVAARQHGAFTRTQALAEGFTPMMIRQRCTSGRWIVLHRGVYAIAGVPRTWRQDVMAAVLACGEGAAASGITAGVLWVLTETPSVTVHVVAASRRRTRHGIVVHEGRLSRTDVRVVDGIPTTGPNRTLVDLAGALTESQLEGALDTAMFRGLTSLKALRRYIDARCLQHRRGVGALNRLIEDRASKGVPESKLERIFLAKLRNSRLPAPTRQFRVGRRRIDMSYPEHRIMVELDGHSTRYARSDLQKHSRRQNEVVLGLPGWPLLRFTWDDVVDDWPYVEATLRRALGA